MASRAGEQRAVYFQGRVQGVGFRYTTSRLAADRAVTGYVKNLEDGRVELIAEGQSAEIDRLLEDIRGELGGNIHQEQSDSRPATGQYDRFEVRY